MSSWAVDHLWLVPAIPFAAALLILSSTRSRGSLAAGIAILGQLATLMVALLAFVPTLQEPGYRAFHNFTWFRFGDQALLLGWVLDPLTGAMLVMVTFVGLWIFVFSKGYMAGDKDFSRFFACLSFFSGAMLGVVIA